MSGFARFLVDSGLASVDAVLDALCGQVEAQPPLCAVVRRERLLSPADQLRALELQEMSGCGYREAIEKLGLWREPLISRLGQLTLSAAPPFTELLLRSGALDLATLNTAFDEFACQAPGAAPKPEATPAEGDAATSSAPLGDLSATTEPAGAPRFDQGMQVAFQELFDEARRSRLAASVSRWKVDASSAALLAVTVEWEALRAGARFVGAAKVEALLATGIAALKGIAARDRPLGERDNAAVMTLIMEVTDLAWALGYGFPDPTKVSDGEAEAELAGRLRQTMTSAKSLQGVVTRQSSLDGGL